MPCVVHNADFAIVVLGRDHDNADIAVDAPPPPAVRDARTCIVACLPGGCGGIFAIGVVRRGGCEDNKREEARRSCSGAVRRQCQHGRNEDSDDKASAATAAGRSHRPPSPQVERECAIEHPRLDAPPDEGLADVNPQRHDDVVPGENGNDDDGDGKREGSSAWASSASS